MSSYLLKLSYFNARYREPDYKDAAKPLKALIKMIIAVHFLPTDLAFPSASTLLWYRWLMQPFQHLNCFTITLKRFQLFINTEEKGKTFCDGSESFFEVF